MSCNARIIKFVAEDIILLFNTFGYNTFFLRDTKDIKLRHSLKKLLNEEVVYEFGKKTNGRINYKLSKFVVDKCLIYEKKFSRPKDLIADETM
jgi:hypothetical protein